MSYNQENDFVLEDSIMVLICRTCDKQNQAKFIRVLEDGNITLMCLECIKELESSFNINNNGKKEENE